jgi:SAM-dependent methyltransferase
MARWWFEIRYLLGGAPWDTAVTPPEVVQLVEEAGLAPGRGLDLGCGTGTNAIYLARHGWEAVGVDFSVLAVHRARRRARRAGVTCRFYAGDVTDLSFLTDPFTLALDIGCLHSLSGPARVRYATEVARLVHLGGWYLLYAFLPSGDRPGRRGLTAQELDRLFGGHFIVERQEGGRDLSGPGSAWYWMRRRQPTPGEDNPPTATADSVRGATRRTGQNGAERSDARRGWISIRKAWSRCRRGLWSE